MSAQHDRSMFDQAAEHVVEIGNRLTEKDPEASPWDIADGLIAGAVQYWLYSRQPCGDPACEACEAVNTAARRLAELVGEVKRLAEESEYYHSPNDIDVGRA